ncbi:hypothetical protein N7493_008997 [Penicillium malachiteum]|uniref:Uncharacterized protein n=1 Tax=Penicillium malachiteum TaxID=1324776 RepID=A0AAD6HFN3_9EURO|nr:hypothetical protein N7493_008997 [Penicillium malachiteum]
MPNQTPKCQNQFSLLGDLEQDALSVVDPLVADDSVQGSLGVVDEGLHVRHVEAVLGHRLGAVEGVADGQESILEEAGLSLRMSGGQRGSQIVAGEHCLQDLPSGELIVNVGVVAVVEGSDSRLAVSDSFHILQNHDQLANKDLLLLVSGRDGFVILWVVATVDLTHRLADGSQRAELSLVTRQTFDAALGRIVRGGFRCSGWSGGRGSGRSLGTLQLGVALGGWQPIDDPSLVALRSFGVGVNLGSVILVVLDIARIKSHQSLNSRRIHQRLIHQVTGSVCHRDIVRLNGHIVGFNVHGGGISKVVGISRDTVGVDGHIVGLDIHGGGGSNKLSSRQDVGGLDTHIVGLKIDGGGGYNKFSRRQETVDIHGGGRCEDFSIFRVQVEHCLSELLIRHGQFDIIILLDWSLDSRIVSRSCIGAESSEHGIILIFSQSGKGPAIEARDWVDSGHVDSGHVDGENQQKD